MSSYWSSSLVDESTRRCAIRVPVLELSWWNRTVLRLTAEYSFTGTLTSPNEMAPLHIDLGIGPIVVPRTGFRQRAHHRLRIRPPRAGRPADVVAGCDAMLAGVQLRWRGSTPWWAPANVNGLHCGGVRSAAALARGALTSHTEVKAPRVVPTAGQLDAGRLRGK